MNSNVFPTNPMTQQFAAHLIRSLIIQTLSAINQLPMQLICIENFVLVQPSAPVTSGLSFEPRRHFFFSLSSASYAQL